MKKNVLLIIAFVLCFNVFSMNLYANEETKFNDDLQKIYEVMDDDDFVDVWIENKVNVDVKDIVNKRLNEEFALSKETLEVKDFLDDDEMVQFMMEKYDYANTREAIQAYMIKKNTYMSEVYLNINHNAVDGILDAEKIQYVGKYIPYVFATVDKEDLTLLNESENVKTIILAIEEQYSSEVDSKYDNIRNDYALYYNTLKGTNYSYADIMVHKDMGKYNGYDVVFIHPMQIAFSDAIEQFKIGNEEFVAGQTGYANYFFVYKDGDFINLLEAYYMGLVNDDDMFKIALNSGMRKQTFSDVSVKDWFYRVVEQATRFDLMGNTGNNLFEPNVPMSRGMVATVLHRMAGRPNVEFNNIFKDVTNSQLWYSNGIIWASNNHIVSGHKDGTFKPDDSITRQDLMVMVYNYYNYAKGIDIVDESQLNHTKDYTDIDAYATNAVRWCYRNGIISGSKQVDGIYIYPKKHATRAEFAKMSVLLHDLLKAE